MSTGPAHKAATRHALKRTSPKGGPFIGMCMQCGLEGISLSDFGECPNPAGFTEGESLIRLIRGDA